MTSYCIKLVCLLFITNALFCFADGGFLPRPNGFGEVLGKSSLETAGSVHGADSLNTLAPEDTVYPTLTRTTTPVNNNLPSSPNIQCDPKTLGENLATKYFGKDFIKGFRWGYKVGKRIHSIASKCEKVMDALNSASCPKPNPLLNSDIVNCVVEVYHFNGLDGTCHKTYESSQVPPEATCNLDHEPATLGPDNCVKIKP